MIQSAGMVLRGGTRMLAPVVGEGAPRDARILMAHVMGVEPGRLTPELSRVLTPAQVSQFEHLIRRRMTRQPISQIIGHRLFWGRRFRVTPDVLDPRPETETLVATALEAKGRRILDLGTGSGCILATLLAEWPEATGLGTDVSDAALEVAQANAGDLGVSDRATFRQGSWWDAVDGAFDLVVSNPPYIAEAELAALDPDVREHEPLAALSPGGDGLDAYRAIAAGLAGHLAPSGRALFEIGPTQGADVQAIFAAAGFAKVSTVADMDGRDRVVCVA